MDGSEDAQQGDLDLSHILDQEPSHGDDFPLDHGESMEAARVGAHDRDAIHGNEDTQGDIFSELTGVAEHGSASEHDDVTEHDKDQDQLFRQDRATIREHDTSPEKALLHGPESTHVPRAVGVHFVEAIVHALDYELNERFWGWRRNDLIRFTDNIENMQLGILEVVRRAVVVLTERISRHGVSASIDYNLENSMNWLMIKPNRYWLPSAEEKYGDSLKELKEYMQKLERGEARFYVRADNLIPLLLSFADLAGSCDENLVKSVEDDGSPVSWFKADDYFYYSKGVAKAMGSILHAVREDFSGVLEARQGVDLLNRAIHACHVAAELDPWLVTDGALDGILANHRANMAAEISHLRYFLNALAKALAT